MRDSALRTSSCAPRSTRLVTGLELSSLDAWVAHVCVSGFGPEPWPRRSVTRRIFAPEGEHNQPFIYTASAAQTWIRSVDVSTSHRMLRGLLLASQMRVCFFTPQDARLRHRAPHATLAQRTRYSRRHRATPAATAATAASPRGRAAWRCQAKSGAGEGGCGAPPSQVRHPATRRAKPPPTRHRGGMRSRCGAAAGRWGRPAPPRGGKRRRLKTGNCRGAFLPCLPRLPPPLTLAPPPNAHSHPDLLPTHALRNSVPMQRWCVGAAARRSVRA